MNENSLPPPPEIDKNLTWEPEATLQAKSFRGTEWTENSNWFMKMISINCTYSVYPPYLNSCFDFFNIKIKGKCKSSGVVKSNISSKPEQFILL